MNIGITGKFDKICVFSHERKNVMWMDVIGILRPCPV